MRAGVVGRTGVEEDRRAHRIRAVARRITGVVLDSDVLVPWGPAGTERPRGTCLARAHPSAASGGEDARHATMDSGRRVGIAVKRITSQQRTVLRNDDGRSQNESVEIA